MVEISLRDRAVFFLWQLKGLMHGDQGFGAEMALRQAVGRSRQITVPYAAGILGLGLGSHVRTAVGGEPE